MSKRFPDSAGPSQRQLRVGELIRRTISDVLMRGEIHDPDLARISWTVGEVRVTPDLSMATAYVLPLGGDRRAEALELLRKNKGELRRALGRAMTIKFIPDLRFEIDETYDRIEQTRRMFADAQVQQDIAAPGDTASDPQDDRP